MGRSFFFLPPLIRLISVVCCCIPLAASGCATRVSTDAIRTELASDHLHTLETELEETHDAFGEFVTACNLARVYQLSGRWADSIRAFNDALTLLEDYEKRAVVNVRELLAGAGTILFSRGAVEYYGMGYERSLLHTFNALNYLMLGDFTGAAVEMRRMDQRQAVWLEESQARIDKYLESEKRLDSPDDLPDGYSMRQLLRDQEVRALVNNYQEPFSYALAAILFRLSDDARAADVSMRRATALNDEAGALFAAAWPAPAPKNNKNSARPKSNATALEQEAAPAYAVPPLPPPPGRFTVDRSLQEHAEQETMASPPQADTQEVTVIVFTGLAPALRVETARIWLPAIGYLMVDLPAYVRPVSGTKPRVTAAADSGETEISLYPLLRTDMLAYRTLWDEVSMELTFAVSRALTRAGISAATYTVARSHEDTRDYALLIAHLTTVLMDIFTSSMAESVRNWETLPNAGYLAMTEIPCGSAVTVSVGGHTSSVDLPLDARGVIIIATELSNSNLKVHHVTY